MEQRLPNWLKQRAYLTPERKAVIFENETLTFHDLFQKAVDLAAKITSYSISKGDTVGIMLSNHIDTFSVIHAQQQTGAKTLFLNLRLTPSELAWQLQDANAKLLIADAESLGKLKEIQNECPELTCISLSELIDSPKSAFEPEEEFSLDSICSLMYTSGTTGRPKGVKQTYGNHWWSASGSSLNLGLSEKDVWGCTVPLFHISGFSILMRSVIYGMPVRLFSKFDVEAINQCLIQGEITILSVVTSMLQRLLADLNDQEYHEQFRCMLLGGGPAPLTVLEQCRDKGIPVFQTYGMTETSSQIVTLAPEDSIRKLGSAGKPLFPCQVKIMKDQEDAPPNVEGEIVVKGPNVTHGYLNRDDANKESFHNGWFKTGDIGYLDEDGFVYVLDRRSDLIISGGENIYPAEIENVLLSHPDVSDAGVKGMDDPQWGEVPHAFVVSNQDLTEHELLDYCRRNLAKYKLPKKIHFVNELPRNASNKLLRRQLPGLISEVK
ncbi:o-succinylbenzoate--CoA ligase [Falsibacillus pallidus]|uniref:2-succinylbenzoate--CoA ligase n=1 Tax=Falsibacillus pallidus TaxID=493781 RepID=A0A370GQY4_9BACI|nr:o-succinylbenzoate--CoA ligase [Falsibacillus pallidus]RDI44373.1 2-succinylbenzoyl-CoA synthetase [Falsibacillus pallidus]